MDRDRAGHIQSSGRFLWKFLCGERGKDNAVYCGEKLLPGVCESGTAGERPGEDGGRVLPR